MSLPSNILKHTNTLWIAEIAFSTFFTEVTSKVFLAWTFSLSGFTMVASCSIHVTFTWSTVGISKITFSTSIAVWRLEFHSAFALTSFFFAISSGIKVVTITSCNLKLLCFILTRSRKCFKKTYADKHQFHSNAFHMVCKKCLYIYYS